MVWTLVKEDRKQRLQAVFNTTSGMMPWKCPNKEVLVPECKTKVAHSLLTVKGQIKSQESINSCIWHIRILDFETGAGGMRTLRVQNLWLVVFSHTSGLI